MTHRENVYLEGSNELILFYRDGAYHVEEFYVPDKVRGTSSYGEVFSGSYTECHNYLKQREAEYLLSRRDA